jgi:hypothetical protein
MKDLVMLIAGITPAPELIKQIKDAILEYEITPSEDAQKKVEMFCMLLLSKQVTGDLSDGPEKFIEGMKRMERVEKASRLYGDPTEG